MIAGLSGALRRCVARAVFGARARSTRCCCPTITPRAQHLTSVVEPQMRRELPEIEPRRYARRHAAVDAGVDVGARVADDVAAAVRRFVADVVALIRSRPAHRSVRMGDAPRVAQGPEVAFRRATVHRRAPSRSRSVRDTGRVNAVGDRAGRHRRRDSATARVRRRSGRGGRRIAIRRADDPNFTRLNDALTRTARGASTRQAALIKGCAAVALTDGATASERALLIGVAATLDCPLPPDLAL